MGLLKLDRRLGPVVPLLAAAMLLVPLLPADAKTTFDSAYTLEQTYNAALRLVRVDLGLHVTEKDPDIAYLLFDYKSVESGRGTTPGSIEMVSAGPNRGVKVVVQLPQMPRYHEQVLTDALEKKLLHEYGDPPPRPPPPPDAGPSPDDGGSE